MPDLPTVLRASAALCCGGAAASGWTAAVIGANAMFDGLDPGRADRSLRRLISSTAGFQALLLGVAAGLALFGGATGAAIVAIVAALGFLSNVWTLAPRREKAPAGVRKRTSTTRIVAVALTLIVTMAALAAGGLAVLSI